ncbi:chalcone synthase B [Lophiotrema nucula]|uniref:Chalcone synthase B n=1 Tax=Lophiotrema nucula TaxID=690887 RepID=A0A6A5Z394_9PLEO|nr:chalcone synthase B [Lophiotrema nucula]
MSPSVDRRFQSAEEEPSPSRLWITGLGAQYPPYAMDPEAVDRFATRFFNVESPGLKKLLEINKNTGIEARSSIRTYEHGFGAQSEPPSIVEIDKFFRQFGVDLTAQACKKALREWGGERSSITHTIGVTCTTQGNPGYDLLVRRKLGLRPDVDRMLLHGVGCAGGLAIMRAAAQIASGATARRRPARILCFACELCTPNARCDLADAEMAAAEDVSIAGALFSDGAAAFVLCNSIGLEEETEPLFELMEWGTGTLPGTEEHMGFITGPIGFRTVLTRDVPNHTKEAVKPMFDELLPSYAARASGRAMTQDDFDWALHPGGEAIIENVKQVMSLNDHQLRATREIYRTRGNSSSPTVLIVLDKLRTMGRGSDHVVATSFGPGLQIEMAMMRRCRDGTDDM